MFLIIFNSEKLICSICSGSFTQNTSFCQVLIGGRFIYLGSFKRELIQNKFEFDSKYERISEDADLNYHIRKSGQKIFISSHIKVFYYPRETLIKFLKLMFGYGVSSGLFIQKNKTIKLRQSVLPLAFILVIILSYLSLFNAIALTFLITLVSIYLLLISIFSIQIGKYNFMNIIFSIF